MGSAMKFPGKKRGAWIIGMIIAIAIPPSLATAQQGQRRRPVPAPAGDSETDPGLQHRTWTVKGRQREALLHVPETARTTPSPVVFAFHGHGGTMRRSVRMFGFHRLWPEAIVVYMQGLNTPSPIDPQGRHPGWQHAPKDQGDRDVAFFDAVLKSLQEEFQVDMQRICATGHSNGGAFTYVLWATRGERLSAVAPSGYSRSDDSWRKLLDSLTPKPVMHVAGRQDNLAKFEWQRQTMEHLKQLNECGEGTRRGEFVTVYPSESRTPVLTFIHPGGHAFPEAAAPAIVRFFKGPPSRD